MSISVSLRLLILVTLSVVSLSSGCVIERNQRRDRIAEDRMLSEDVFGLWVTRWDYQSKQDIENIVRDAASAGVTDLFWQIRGQGDAYYRSKLEPWGEELTRDRSIKPGEKPTQSLSNHRRLDPGFDPFEYAISQAHSRGVRIHAWMNMMPLWKGKTPPLDPSHAFYTHPEWRLSDETGKVQPLGDGYVVVNPVLDEVQDHLVAVVADVVARYDIDGIHLDYIRFLTDELGKEKLYPADSKSLSLYARQVGDRATVGQLNRTKYRAWIRDRITHLVRRIKKEAIVGHPEVRYTSAVWRRPELARDQYLQDAARWVNEGIVDEVIPMIYTDKDTQFEDDLEAWYSAVDRKRVIAGIGVYKHNSGGQTLSQVTLGHPRRFVLFAFSSIFESSNPDQDSSPQAVRGRELKRRAISQFIDRIGT